ncbi:hypothetical protein [Streptomyces caatingaensis]|nr:hypothetical protein [Streptomyces caatingaensis]
MRRLAVVLLGILAFFGFAVPSASAVSDHNGLRTCSFGDAIGPVESPIAVTVGLPDCLMP